MTGSAAVGELDIRLLRTRRYVASLPNKLDSYPELRQKASLYMNFWDTSPTKGVVELLPPVLAELVSRRVASAWIPEVHFNALCLAVCDINFTNDDAFVQHFLDVNRKLMSSPMYKLVMWVASPTMLLSGAKRRWGLVHDGLVLETVFGEGTCTIRMAYPNNLTPRLIARAYGTALQAALEASSPKELSVTLSSWSPTEVVYDARWA
jgi:hypothetical protein